MLSQLYLQLFSLGYRVSLSCPVSPEQSLGYRPEHHQPGSLQLLHRRRGVCSPEGKQAVADPPWLLLVFQNLKQQYYTGYMESEVLEVMQHMAKNVVKVNENLTKFIVSAAVPTLGKHSILGRTWKCGAGKPGLPVSKEWNMLTGQPWLAKLDAWSASPCLPTLVSASSGGTQRAGKAGCLPGPGREAPLVASFSCGYSGLHPGHLKRLLANKPGEGRGACEGETRGWGGLCLWDTEDP